MKRILVPVVAVYLAVLTPCLATAQTHSAKRVPAKPEVTKPEVTTQPVVDIRDTFALETSSEHWALEDPIPPGSVDFGGRKLSLDERQVGVSTSNDGEKQLLFPVSWFEAYQGQNPELKYVVIKYRDGRACSIMAEYQPDRVALPKANFKPHPDGKSFYSDVAVVRQAGHVYLKQVVSQGHDDGKGGLWVDMVVMYCLQDKTSSANPASARQP
jgi:hypothetical protein